MLASIYRAVEAEEAALAEILGKRVTVLESELEAALKLACDNLDKAVEARKEQAQQVEAANEAVQKMLEELKKMMASNLELTRQNGNLMIEVALARKDALLLRKEALMAGDLPGPSDA